MKLLLIIDSLGSGGAQRQMVTLASGLAANGHHVEIFTYYDEGHFAHVAEKSGVAVHLVEKPSRYSIRPVRALRRLMQSGKFDCALAFLETPSVYAELASIGSSKTRLVVSERFCYSPGTLGWRRRVQQELHRLAEWITVNSFHQREVMVGMFPWMKPKIGVIWNGVDAEHFRKQPLPSRRAGVLRVQVLASLARKKNPLGLARAVAICQEKYGLKVEVNWAGRFSDEGDGKVARDETVAFLDSSALSSSWTWSGEVKDVRALLAQADVVVHPSFAEGLPNAICEAFASGRSVLASDIGDHARLVGNGDCGLLFDPEDPHNMATALTNYSRLSLEQQVRMSQAARDYAERQLSTARFVRSYEELFAQIVQ